MKFYTDQTVLEAAKDRIRWVYKEFQTVYVCLSGGKDSTIILNLALEVAEEMGRLPVPVVFIDQEAEWESVIDYVREVMADPRVLPRWLQVPFKITSATSKDQPWLYCWDPTEEANWIRPKEPGSIQKNVYGTDRFAKLFTHYLRYHHYTRKAAYLSGVRAQESPGRMLGLSKDEVYKGETWGSTLDRGRGHYTFYPIYDWQISDVWKAIHEHGWSYTTLYDSMYQYGVQVHKMRVSSVNHETSMRSLFYLQEIEGQTWEKIQNRIHGVHAAATLRDDFWGPIDLPPMFKDWWEYRDHLVENLCDAPTQAKFKHIFAGVERRFPTLLEDLVRVEIQAVLTGDTTSTKINNFCSSNFMFAADVGLRSFGGKYGPALHRAQQAAKP